MTVKDITIIPDHADVAISRLTQIYKDPVKKYSVSWSPDLKSGWEVMVHAFTIPSQSLENVMGDMLADRALDTAKGVNLDRIGQIVGQDRQGLDDVDYLTQIQAQIAENNSDGTGNNLLVIAGLILGPIAKFLSIKEMFPAKVILDVGVIDTNHLIVTSENNELTIYDVGQTNPFLLQLPTGTVSVEVIAAAITDAFLNEFGLTVPVSFDGESGMFTIELTGSTGSIVFGTAAALLGFESFGFASNDTVIGWGVIDIFGDTIGGGLYDTFDNGSFISADVTGISLTEVIKEDITLIKEAILGAKAAGVGLGIELVLDGNYFGMDSDDDAVGFGSLVAGVTIGGGNYASLNL